MSSDLIKRLRMGAQVPEFELRQEAADEIERLRADAGLYATGDRSILEQNQKYKAEIERLEQSIRFHEKHNNDLADEIERLRRDAEALQSDYARLHHDNGKLQAVVDAAIVVDDHSGFWEDTEFAKKMQSLGDEIAALEEGDDA